MPDTFQVTSSSNWFSRIGRALTGIIVGIVLLVIGIGLLFWNEGRAVETFKTLKEGQGIVIETEAGAVDGANEGKLVHLTAEAVTDETLADEEFGIAANAIRLHRDVEMFQWVESKESTTQKKLGGGEETVTTYTYAKKWSNMLRDSSDFQVPDGHENPSEFPYSSTTWDAGQVGIGAFFLSSDLIGKLNDFADLPVRQVPEDAAWPEDARPEKGAIYLGANPAVPLVGDVRISYSVVEPGPVSLVAQQAGASFASYRAKAGGDIALISAGNLSARKMFESALTQNTIITWLVRLGGFILLWIGFGLLLAPISVLADVVPLFGNLVGAATGLISFLLALALALTVIAFAWLFFRPLLGITLLVLAVAAAVFGFRGFGKKAQAA